MRSSGLVALVAAACASAPPPPAAPPGAVSPAPSVGAGASATPTAAPTSAPSPATIEPAPSSAAVERGKLLYARQGCAVCHSIDGTRKIGPTWRGLVGRPETLADGSEVWVDDTYLFESILEPNAKIVAQYPPSMPKYRGHLHDDEVAALIAYLKTLK